jgi:hypothetical protein
MQMMIGEGLRERYEPPQKLSHELFVLLMQVNERSRAGTKAAPAGDRQHRGANHHPGHHNGAPNPRAAAKFRGRDHGQSRSTAKAVD